MNPAQAARILAAALVRETDANVRSSLASALSTVAGRMEPAEAARVCGDVIRIVLQERTAEPQNRNAIDAIVAMLLPRLDRESCSPLRNELLMLHMC